MEIVDLKIAQSSTRILGDSGIYDYLEWNNLYIYQK